VSKSILAVITEVSLPVHPAHPIVNPPEQPPSDAHPENPIYYPSGPVDPGYGIPEGGKPDNTLPGDLPQPGHPIVLPPDSGNHPDNSLPIPPEVIEAPDKFDAVVGWTATTGWIVVFVPNEGTNVPTPSR
jgi:hypothetical protein